MIIKGEVLRFNEKNLNDRIYTKDSIKNLDEFNQRIQDNNALGEYWPEKRNENYQLISLTNVSHRIKDISINNESLICEVEILDTPGGKLIKKIANSSETLFDKMFCFNSRGTGTVNENNEVENFNLLTIDIIPKKTSSFQFNINNL